VTKCIANPALYEWLGILDFNYVFDLFHMNINEGVEDDDMVEDHENEYLYQRDEMDNYN
jgi:hypothetical protein